MRQCSLFLALTFGFAEMYVGAVEPRIARSVLGRLQILRLYAVFAPSFRELREPKGLPSARDVTAPRTPVLVSFLLL